MVIINLIPYNREAFAAFRSDLSALSFSLLGYFILFYLIGYFSYAVMFAAAGSIVSRTEDLNQVSPDHDFLAAYLLCGDTFGIECGAMYVEILSFVPLFTPVLMFLGSACDPALWESVRASSSILPLGVAGWLAAKVYRAGVLMYGKRPALKEVWKAMRYY